MQLNHIRTIDLSPPERDPSRRPWTVQRVRAFLRRRQLVILLSTLLLFLAGLGYILQRPPTYTAHSRLLLENVRFEPGRAELLPTMNTVESSMLESQAELLRSEAFALRVIERLRLDNDPEFTRKPDSSLLSWIMVSSTRTESPENEPASTESAGLFSRILGSSTRGATEGVSGAELQRDAVLAEFQRRLSVRRLGTTSVLEIGFRAGDPSKSAQVVNELVQVYLADQTAATAAAAASASAWLRERIKELGARSRVIDIARPPLKKEGPGGRVLLAAFTGLGVLLGFAAALSRELLDNTLSDPLQARGILGGTFLGAIAKFSSRGRTRRFTGRSHVVSESNMAPDSDLAYVAGRIRGAAKGQGRVIGVACTVPGEGTTTLATNLAYCAAHAGERVLLIDSNALNKSLSRKLAPASSKGLTDVITGTASFRDMIVRPAGALSFDFLPFGTGKLGDGAALQKFTRTAAEHYDLVVLDMVPTVHAEGNWPDTLDGLVLVIEWGRVPGSLVESGLNSLGPVRKGFLGFVFNKVSPAKVDQSAFPIESYRWKQRSKSR